MAPSDTRKKKKMKTFLASKLSHAALLSVDKQFPSKKPRRCQRYGVLTPVTTDDAVADADANMGGDHSKSATETIETMATTTTRGRKRKRRQRRGEDVHIGGRREAEPWKPLLQPSMTTTSTTKPEPTANVGRMKEKPKSYLEKLQSRLSGGQFRMLNEKLYTCSGEEAFKIFQQDPVAFECYHAGYREQMSHWPSQPLESIIRWLKKRTTSLIVADFGCGDAKLAKIVQNKVFSMDLVASDASVIACNMAHTPLQTQSVDVAVFCLSLMGTDYSSFLIESHRVLRPRGSLLIAEVRSRFDPNNGGADPLAFINALKMLGFSLISKDFSNKLFVMFEFMKQDNKGMKECKWPKLKACIYKRR